MSKSYRSSKKIGRSDRRRKNRNKKIMLILIVISIILISGIVFNFLIINVGKSNKIQEQVLKNENVDSYVKNEEIQKNPIKSQTIISIAGDCTLGTDTKFGYHNSLPAALDNSGGDYSYFMKNVYNIFSQDDYTLVNLETTFTDSEIKADKGGGISFNFKGPKEYVNILSSSSIDGVTISNNHIYDYGTKGIEDTINILKTNNIGVCGEGYKIIKEIKGIKFGFLGYTGWEFSQDLRDRICDDFNELRSNGVEVIIPYFHWGSENEYKPNEEQVAIARFSIDNGADAVIGSHSHVIQSIENYKGKLIAYSMGNFCFGGNFNPSDKRTFILQIKSNFEDGKLLGNEYKVIPVMISSRSDKNDYIPTVALDNRAGILETLNALSPTLNGSIKDEFFTIEIK